VEVDERLAVEVLDDAVPNGKIATTTPERDLTYVYGFAWAHHPAPCGEGVEPGASIARIDVGPIGAIVSSVSADEYAESTLRERLADVDWLAPRVRAHEAVLRAAAEKGPVLPLRFCVLFRDETRVRALLTEHGAAVADELRRLDGKEEWSVKVHLDRASLELTGSDAEVGAALRAEVAASSPGRAHFARRRLERLESEAKTRRAHELAEEVHLALSELAEESIRKSAGVVATEGAPPRVLCAVFLVAESRSEEFAREIDRIGEQPGVQVECTGPWPPFHFARVSLSESATASAQ
jgi:hypothetical protein